jgi:branched-chain amino acid transport system ATP-binding protein
MNDNGIKDTLLEVRSLSSGYGKIQILFDISLTINPRETVALIGHNGAGKTTTLKTIFGLLKAFGGKVSYKGQDITNTPPEMNTQRNIRLIPQEEYIFDRLTVKENLEMCTFTMSDTSQIDTRYEAVFELFPVLKGRMNQMAGSLSGGEQRMLSIGTALLVQPELILLDEPSAGLSPLLVEQVMATIADLNFRYGMAIFLVEQNVKQAFMLSNRAYVMKTGRVILEESGKKLLERGQWWDLF